MSPPSRMARRFMNVTAGEPDTDDISLFVIAGDAPQYTAAAKKIIDEWSASGQPA